MFRIVKSAAAGVCLALALAACANTAEGDDAEPTSTLTHLPAQQEISVPADARRPVGDGKAVCPENTTLAFVGAMTGPNAQYGINMYQAAELAIDEHNEANPGCQVKFKTYDTEGDPAKAPGPVAQVVSEDEIIGVVGVTFSGESNATGGIFEDAGLVHIAPGATGPALSENGWTTFFRGLANDNLQGPAAAGLAEKLGAESVYLVQDDSAYGVGLGEATASALGDRLAGTDRVTTGQKDFSATVSKILNERPDVVFFAGYYAEGAPLAQQLKGKGFDGVFIGSDATKDMKFVELAGDAAEGAYFTCACTPVELYTEFSATYEDVHGDPPGTYSLEGYDATVVLLAGIDAGATTRADLREFVQNYEGQGLAKFLSWDETGELSELSVFGYKVEDGQIVPVGNVA